MKPSKIHGPVHPASAPPLFIEAGMLRAEDRFGRWLNQFAARSPAHACDLAD
jgi:hypothetical protein